MMNKAYNQSQPQESIFRDVLLAYFVLFFHVILILFLGVLVLFFRGVITYLPWILGLGLVVIVVSWYLWWQHMKKHGKRLRDILNDPLFQGRTIEVTFLGGLASFRLGRAQEPLTIDNSASVGPKQISDPATAHSEELNKLAHLLKQDLITIDEFLKAKKEIMGK